MEEKFNGKYRIPSARASWWDYGNPGAYFVTICTKDKVCHFGSISPLKKHQVEQKMHLSSSGEIAHQIWQKIPEQFPFAYLDSFIIMPNHMHGLFVIQTRATREEKITV